MVAVADGDTITVVTDQKHQQRIRIAGIDAPEEGQAHGVVSGDGGGMANRWRWKEGPVEDGYGEIRLRSWRYFTDYVYKEMLDFGHYIWRGQRQADWPLESTLDRLARQHYRTEVQRAQHFERFKYAARGRRGPNPARLDSENDWWALGQHNGLATPLLDWTTSPFVAAYFAFIGVGDPKQATHRAIYALHQNGVEMKVDEIVKEQMKLNEEKKRELEKKGRRESLAWELYNQEPRRAVEFIRPLMDENQRLVSQGGLFTRAPAGKRLDNWVKENFIGKTDGWTLMKILIPDDDRTLCLRTLNRMNINHLSLFPDLFGASEYCNVHLGIDKY